MTFLIRNHRFVLLLITLQAFGAFAQKKEYLMLVDSGLLANGVRYPIKSSTFIKGNYLPGFRFGEFVVASTKKGHSLQRGRSLFFSRYQVESSVLFSYILTKASDSVAINCLINTNSREFYISNGQSSYSDLLESLEYFYSSLQLIQTQDTWELEIQSRIGSKVKGFTEASGVIRYEGQEAILIRPVNYLSSGKKGIAGSFGSNPIFGYELVSDNQVIAAIQLGVVGAPKQFVWLRNDLPRNLEMVSAGTFTAILMMIGQGHFQELY